MTPYTVTSEMDMDGGQMFLDKTVILVQSKMQTRHFREEELSKGVPFH
jgi:hypothetical protein